MNKLFNMTLIKKDFKLHSAFFYLGLLFFFIALPYYSVQEIVAKEQLLANSGVLSSELSFFNYKNLVNLFSPIMIVFSVGLGLSITSEKQRKTMEEIARMPYSRLQIYISKVVVSLFILTFPIVFNLCLFFLVGSSKIGFAIFVDKTDFIIATLNCLVASYFVYFLYLSISMIFGSILGATICTSIFITFPLAFMGLIAANIGLNMSIPKGIFKWLDNLCYYTPAFYAFNAFVYPKILPFILLLTVIFAILGYKLFTVYKMEKNSEFLTFTWTEPIFKVGVLICSVLAGRIIFGGLLSGVGIELFNEVMGMVVGGFLGYIIPKKIIDKSRVA